MFITSKTSDGYYIMYPSDVFIFYSVKTNVSLLNNYLIEGYKYDL